jgi:nitroimidazol reductase NimA-like FMN-containing flavoprotein (pyridoxamine 5'-phosphate oxidase superfamily)
MSEEQTEKEEWRGRVGKLNDEELTAFLDEGQFCRLGCLDKEGWPYVVPCWFEYNDGAFFIVPRAKSVWAKHLQRDKRCFLCIDESTRFNRRVLVKGEAEILEEPNLGGQWVEIARRMSVRYLGEHGPLYLEPTMVEPRWLVRVTPIKMRTWQGVDWPQRYKHAAW